MSAADPKPSVISSQQSCCALVLTLILAVGGPFVWADDRQSQESSLTQQFDASLLDVLFVATPQDVVDKMLETASVTKDDLVYDLGCGDGRIIVTAAIRYGCKTWGCDIDPARVQEARANARKNDVEHLVHVEQNDLFAADLSQATVVTLYLLPEVNLRLLPRLEKMKPGSRIVSHQFEIKGVKPQHVIRHRLAGNGETKIFFYKTPLKREF